MCSRNRWRSPTVEKLYARSQRFDIRSRGLSDRAVRRLGEADVTWADVIIVMETDHRRRLLQDHRDTVGDRPVHVLDIPDDYGFMDPELVELIEGRMQAIVGMG